MTRDAMCSNSERNLKSVDVNQVKEIIAQLDPAAANSMIVDDAVALRRVNYCFIDVVAKHVKYIVDRKHFQPDGELAEMLQKVVDDKGESPYVKMDDRTILAKIAQSPKVSVASTIKNVFVGRASKSDIDTAFIDLNAAEKDLLDDQPLYAVKKGCSLKDCPKCDGTGKVKKTGKDGVEVEEKCIECQGMGKVGSFEFISIEVKTKSEKYLLTVDTPIAYLKRSTIESHVLEHSMVRYRTVTNFNDMDEKDYDEAMMSYVDQLNKELGGEPATEDLYYQIIPCIEFDYRDILSGKICRGAVVDPIDDPELVLNLEATSTKVSTAMKDTAKTIGNIFGTIGRTEKHKSKDDVRRSTRLMIATAIADGQIVGTEKSELLNMMRDMDAFTTGEKNDFVALMGKQDISFLKDDDFKFTDIEKARETLERMKQIANADGQASNEELDLIDRLEQTISQSEKK